MDKTTYNKNLSFIFTETTNFFFTEIINYEYPHKVINLMFVVFWSLKNDTKR